MRQASPGSDGPEELSTGSGQDRDLIFEPLVFRNLTVKNRVFRSSISGRIDNYNGSGTQARVNWEERFARGGVGGIISAHVPVHGWKVANPTRPPARIIYASSCRIPISGMSCRRSRRRRPWSIGFSNSAAGMNNVVTLVRESVDHRGEI